LILLGAMVGMLAVWSPLGGVLGWRFGSVTEVSPSQGALEALAVYGRIPDFALIERSGRQITLADLRGKVWIVYFFYTECPDTCPLQSTRMAWLQDELAPEPDVRLVSISVDPEHDTPEVLVEYAARYGADPDRWLFLTGPKDAIYRLAIDGFHLGIVERGEQAEGGQAKANHGLAQRRPGRTRLPIRIENSFIVPASCWWTARRRSGATTTAPTGRPWGACGTPSSACCGNGQRSHRCDTHTTTFTE